MKLKCEAFDFDYETIQLINSDNIARFREYLNMTDVGRRLLTLKYFIGFVADIHVRESFRHYAECFKKKKFPEIMKIIRPSGWYKMVDLDDLKRELLHFGSSKDRIADYMLYRLVREYNECISFKGHEYEYDAVIIKTMLDDIYERLKSIFGKRMEVFFP